MTKEQLQKANNLAEEIEKIEKNLKAANYYLAEGVAPRELAAKSTSLDTVLVIPDNLCKLTAQLVKSDAEFKLSNLKKQFENL